ncbi:MAG: protein TonB [Paraglaciecola sp.]|jgi:protein TonB
MYAQQTLTVNLPSIGKISSIVLLALSVTFGLFVVMDKLTKLDQITVVKPVTYTSIDPVFHEEEKTLITKIRIKPPVVKEIPKAIPKIVETTPNDKSPGRFGQTITLVQPQIKDGLNTSFGIENGDVRPIVRVEPKYPLDAARNGIEGWVKLTFSIDTLGQVINAEVLEADPKRTFDRAALRALKKWKYKPQIVDGKPLTKDGLIVMLDFKLAVE